MYDLQLVLIIQLSLSHSQHLLEHGLRILQNGWEAVYSLEQQSVIILELDPLHLPVGPGQVSKRFLSCSPSVEIAQPLPQTSAYFDDLGLRRGRCCGCKMLQRIRLQV